MKINENNCFAFAIKFGDTRDADNRVSAGVDGYACKYNGEFSEQEVINFIHCIELKGDSNTTKRQIDNRCSKDIIALDSNKSTSQEINKEIEDINNTDDYEIKLKKLKRLYEQKLITKEEYDKKRKEILDTI